MNKQERRDKIINYLDEYPNVGIEPFFLIKTARKYIIELEVEVKRLKQLHHDIYEVYAGADSFPLETAAEGYMCRLVAQMAKLAAMGKS